MGWKWVLVICGLIVTLLSLVISLRHKNPVILDRPQPDSRRDRHRNYSVGGDCK